MAVSISQFWKMPTMLGLDGPHRVRHTIPCSLSRNAHNPG